jgi:IS1 family transposase
MNKLPSAKRAQILHLLVEGNSMQATSRIADVSFNSVVKLLIDAGTACSEYQDEAFRNLKCRRLQVDEIWSFVHCKQRNVGSAKAAPSDAGDIWTWMAIDADTKLVPSWLVGHRDTVAAKMFIDDLASRLSNRVQLTSDGHKPYLQAVEDAFGDAIDYAVLVKVYGDAGVPPGRYSPGPVVGSEPHRVTGRPDPRHVSTSFVERQNLTICMSNRRFTRLTNAFSKTAENHAHSIALHYMHYNVVRMHKTLRCSPAMAAGVTTKLWSIMDIVDMIDAKAAPAKRPTVYKLRNSK